MAHKLAGMPVQEQDIIDVQTLVDAYFDNAPDVTDPTQLVSFGTSGHRGTSLNGTFTDLHVAAITQAICDGRGQFGATGPIFVGQDTHALSQPALVCLVQSFDIMKVTIKKQMVSLLHHLTILQIMGALSIMLPTVALQIR